MINAYSTLGLSLEMDFALLALTGQIIGYRATVWRLTLGSVLGSLPTLWVLIQHNLYSVPWIFSAAWPVLMLSVALGRLPRRLWIKTYAAFLGLSFLIGGTVYFLLTRLSNGETGLPYLDWILLAPVAFIALGRYIPKGRIRQYLGQSSIGEATVVVQGQSLTVRALWDSGNQMRDPVLRRPVAVLEMQAAIDWVPLEVFRWVTAVIEGATPSVPEGWTGRLGLASYHSLGGAGVMPVLAVDSARGRIGDRWLPMVPMVVGFTNRPVSQDQSYQMLVSPACLIEIPQEGVGA